MYKIGIDVGGTNTDAVLCDRARNILAEVKCPTTEDVYGGILQALHRVLEVSGVSPAEVSQAMLGTTQCTNAIVERKHLAPFAVLRIGAPASTGIPPMTDWAEELRRFCVGQAVVSGGFEFDGRLLAELDRDGCRRFLESVRGRAEAVAVSCVFSTVRDDHEREAASMAREILGPEVPVSISSEIGDLGLIERENATILNAALHRVARRFTLGFAESLRQEGITAAEIYLSQNDGTLMTLEQAGRYPIRTIACGPTNSIRGAGWLSGCRDAIIIDVGGTTTDLGVIRNGFPRESGVASSIGDVRTNFRMPDILSIGLGGGSIVRTAPDGRITVGPDSVGYAITEKALVFEGDTLTASDIAVRLGMAEMGDPALVAHIDPDFARRVMDVIREMAEDALDAMKTSAGDADVILVGGGSVILPQTLAGAGTVLRPDHFGVANAIGGAISKVSGSFEGLFDYDRADRASSLETARNQAVARAVRAGAKPGTVEIVEVEEVPLAYHPGRTSRIKVKAAGDLV